MIIRSRLKELAEAVYYKYLTPPVPNNLGERDVEYSWFASKIPSFDYEVEERSALDIGGATSWLSLLLGRLGYNTTTVDLRTGQELFSHPSVNSLQGDVLELPTPAHIEDRFDLIVSCSVIENMGLDRYKEGLDSQASSKHMSTCVRLLKPGGKLLMSTQLGQHKVVPKLHRIYDAGDMASLLHPEFDPRRGITFGSPWRRLSIEYWAKLNSYSNSWEEISRDKAYSVGGAYYNYALGLFELEKA